MTREEKQLLFIDLCARLPYGIIVHIHDIDVDDYDRQLIGEDLDFIELDRRSCKPYLRPMSSMTEDEKEEIALIRDRDFQSVKKWVHDESIKETGNICPIACGETDYCNEHHFDYRGLIPMGLALEAPEGMYLEEN